MKSSKVLSGAILSVALSWWAPSHAGVVTDWNAITLQCVQGGASPANRGGPAGLLDIALVQAAVHDAVQAVEGKFRPYEYDNKAMRGVGSTEAAAANAAYGVLKGLYEATDPCLTQVTDPAVTYAGDPGLLAGTEAANALLPLYRPTMVLPTDPFVGGTAPGEWRPTPGVTQGANTFMAVTAPFAMKRPSQFRSPKPPRLKSWRYLHDYNEVLQIGSATSTKRSAAQTELARFWSMNFFPQLFEAVRAVANERVAGVGEQARLLALVSFAAADSQISIYETKYVYNFWRPITAIREGDNDGNPWTIGDASWTPFLNTPPYPEYSSGANCLIAAAMTTLQRYFGTDKVPFAVWSTASGVTQSPRTYERLSHVMDEVVDARIYQGIHFRFADEIGRMQGKLIGHWTFDHYLRPVRRKDK